jgi:hypothetical protein
MRGRIVEFEKKKKRHSRKLDRARGRCHANLNLRREVRKSQLGLMLPSRLDTSGTCCL